MVVTRAQSAALSTEKAGGAGGGGGGSKGEYAVYCCGLRYGRGLADVGGLFQHVHRARLLQIPPELRLRHLLLLAVSRWAASAELSV
jgi:hypothetical protein